MSPCPGEETLRLLGADAFGDGTFAAIEQHVEDCTECKAVLERLAHRHVDTKVVLHGAERFPRIPGFEIQSELGRGAMGIVYWAIETGLDRPVALKIVPGVFGSDANSRTRRHWLREARAVSSVRHPNVVPLYDYGEADGCFFLVLEYIPGGSLKQRLAEPLAPRTAAALMETIARAVGYIHGHRLFHLDLKPSNILLDGEAGAPWDRVTPRVSDFGLALSDGDHDASETSLAGPRGTPSYMAPEQANAARVTIGAPADIYALGAILYELLTGRPPFQGSSTAETLDQVRGQQPVPPRRLNPKVPRDLETIALKCVEKTPARRYASAETLAEDLRRWLDGRPIQARPVSPAEHAARWCRRQPMVAALAATLFVTVLGSFLGLLILLRRSETLRSRSEADYQVAARSLDELFAVFLDDEQKHPRGFGNTSPRSKALETARSQGIELSKRYPLDTGGLRRLAVMDEILAADRDIEGKPDEARSLIEESIDCLEAALVRAPDDLEIRRRLLVAIVRILRIHTRLNNDYLYDRWNGRAIALLEPLKAVDQVYLGEVSKLARVHRVHTDALISRGESGRARRELEVDLDLVRSVPVAQKRSAEFALAEPLTLAALERWSGVLSSVRSSGKSRRVAAGIAEMEMDLAELTARRIGWLPSIDKSRSPIAKDLPSDAWTDRVISAMQADAAAFDLDRRQIPAIALCMRGYYCSALMWLRKLDKLADARLLVDQLLTLAQRLRQSHPDQSAAYIFLSYAYVQRAKNAYRFEDGPVFESEQRALGAATHAAGLEPENVVAIQVVKDCRTRLNKLLAK